MNRKLCSVDLMMASGKLAFAFSILAKADIVFECLSSKIADYVISVIVIGPNSFYQLSWNTLVF